MCGFYGSFGRKIIDKKLLNHRGPDNFGIYADENITLEHWRLSIIDLSPQGNQPMILGEGEIILVYNGEVYNFKELKSKTSNINYNSTSDTEVLLHLYAEFGLDFLLELNGMFALAVYDKINKRLILARDRFGIKPLYYSFDTKQNLSFSSELKALTYNRSYELTIDTNAIKSLFHLLYIQGDRTPFNEIKKLPPGHYLVYNFEEKTHEIKKFNNFIFNTKAITTKQCVNAIDDMLSASIKMHLISDVPVGALLSGGIDSSLMVAIMNKFTKDIRTFSVGYEDGSIYDETLFSNIVAKLYKTRHFNARLEQNNISNIIDNVCSLLDEPIGDTSVFLNYYIFNFVSKKVKVCLSGLGGDELFGGYNRYLACRMVPIFANIPVLLKKIATSAINFIPDSRTKGFGNKIRLIKTFLKSADKNLGSTYSKIIDYFTGQELSPVVSGGQFANTLFESCWEEQFVDEMNRIFKYDIISYMVDDLLFITDRMSMIHSLEVRVPYLENNLVNFCLSIAPTMKIKRTTLKYILKETASRYLPDEVIFRRKQGFSSPISALLSTFALDNLSNELEGREDNFGKIINKKLFLDLISNHKKGLTDYSLQIFTLIVYLKWADSFSSSHPTALAH